MNRLCIWNGNGSHVNRGSRRICVLSPDMFFLFSYSTNNFLQIDNTYGTRTGTTTSLGMTKQPPRQHQVRRTATITTIALIMGMPATTTVIPSIRCATGRGRGRKEDKWGSNDETMFRRLSPRLVFFLLFILFLLTNIYLQDY
jgi:hypothetical protein